ncbi:DNA cytosine methyltransferase [Halorubrum luteum]
MGGLDEGLETAGFDIVGAVDKSEFVGPNFPRNFPDTPFHNGDVRNLLEDDFQDREDGFEIPDDLDLVAGGPPCQGVSQIGPRDLDDVRNDLFEVFVKVVAKYKPKAVLMENVPNIHQLGDGRFDEEVIEGLRSNGYSNAARVNFHAEQFGVPQKRERAFYFATRDDLGALDYECEQFVKALADTMRVEEPVTVWEAISDLPDEVVEDTETMPYPDCEDPTPYQKEMRRDYDGDIYSANDVLSKGVCERDPERLHHQHTKGITQVRIDRIQHLEPGDDGSAIPDELWDGRRWKYRRLPFDEPSHTLTAQMHRDLAEWVHPKEELVRWITVREAMRLQSFHDGFVLGVSEYRQLEQIGNSVPPLLGRVVGEISQALIENASEGKMPTGVQAEVQSTLKGF